MLAMAAPQPDPSALGLIAAEVARSLDFASAELRRWEAEPVETEALESANRALRQVRGALEVAGVIGVPRLVQELEALLLDIRQGQLPPEAAAVALSQDALAAVRDYLAQLASGAPGDVLGLSPVLQRLMTARGSDRLAGLALFHPDLSPLPPERATDGPGKAGTAADTAALRHACTYFQKGLLAWLRNAEPNGLLVMRAAVESVEAMCSSPSARAPWWIAAGFLDLLAEGKLQTDVHVKRACSALEQQMRRTLDDGMRVPEALMRELLYFVASSSPGGERADAIRRTYRLGAAPALAPAPAGRSVPFMRQFAPLRELEPVLERASAGDAASLRSFRAGVEEVLRDAPRDAALAELLDELLRATQALGARPADPEAPLAVEMATVLLFLQDILSRWTEPDDELRARVQAATRRLRASCENPAVADGGWASLFGAARRRAQDTALTERLLSELIATLTQAEHGLSSYFENRTRADALAAAERALAQTGGALQLVAEDRAGAVAGYCLDCINRLRAADGEGRSEDFEHLAAVMSGLRYYAEQRRFGPADFAAIMAKAGAPRSLYAAVEPAMVETVDPAQPSPAAPHSDAAAAPQPHAVATTPHRAERPAANEAEAADTALLNTFADEVTEVLASVQQALAKLRERNDSIDALATLRRGFHTLRGSSRMVQLDHLGESAGQLEQLVDRALEGAAAVDPDLLQLIELAHARLSDWITRFREDAQAQLDTTAVSSWAAQIAYAETPAPAAQQGAAAAAPLAPDHTPSEPGEIEIGGVRVSQTLFDTFLKEADQLLEALDATFTGLASGSEADSLAVGNGVAGEQEFSRLAHTLSGISGTVGFDSIHRLAGALETLASRMSAGAGPAFAHHRAMIGQALTALHSMAASVRACLPPEPQESLTQAMLELAQRAPAMRATANVVAETSGPSEPPGTGVPATAEPETAVEETVIVALPMPARHAPAGPTESAAPPAVAHERQMIEDDIDPQLLPIFLEEAADLMPQIAQQLRTWRTSPDRQHAPQALTRMLHTLKGSARMAGAMVLGELTHSIETRISIAARLAVIPDSVLDGLEASFDRMGQLLDLLSRLQVVDAATGVGPPVHDAAGLDDRASRTLLSTETPNIRVDERSQALTSAVSPASARRQQAGQSPVPAAGGSVLRVQADLLERLTAEAGEVAITRSRMEGEVHAIRSALREMAQSVERLRSQAREIEIQAESQIQSRLTVHSTQGALDPLEFDRFTRLQELTRFASETASDVATLQQNILQRVDGCEAALAAQARMTRVLQDALLSVRLVAFSSLSERLFRVVRLTAREAGKPVNADIRGAAVELDRGILDRIAGPLEHLLRNCVVHGIEPVEQRRAAGKPEVGEIVLEISQQANEARLIVTDDGAGLDVEGLRGKAIAAGLMRAEDQLSDRDIAQFAFVPGISTLDHVTEAAGRGVGLDVVRNEISALGGRVEVGFERGRGTSFTIHLPLMVTTMQVLLTRCAGQLFALPTAIVEQTRRVDAETLERARVAGQLAWQERAYPFRALWDLLGMAPPDTGTRRSFALVLVSAGTERAAIQVEDVVAHQEVVVKSIGLQVARIAGIAGAAVLGSGEIVLIVNPVRLTRSLAPGVPAPARGALAAPSAAGEAVATVMVVDDSVTIRKITSRVLARHGYRVIEARDGLEALDKLRDTAPQVMLLDVEMPRMDGFELLQRLRADSDWQHLPVIMITSRTAEKHRSFAAQLGVQAFLSKPFEEDDLLARLAGLLAVAS